MRNVERDNMIKLTMNSKTFKQLIPNRDLKYLADLLNARIEIYNVTHKGKPIVSDGTIIITPVHKYEELS